MMKKEKQKTKKPLAPKKRDIKNNVLRILILEDNPPDSELMERQLKKAGITFTSRRVDTRSGFIQALKSFKPDLILADYTLPKFNAMQALEMTRKKFPFLSFILVTGSIGEEKAVACLRAGADDYLLKDHLARLGEAVRIAMENRRLKIENKAAVDALLESEKKFRDLAELLPQTVFETDLQGRLTFVNHSAYEFMGYDENDFRNGLQIWQLLVPGDRERAAKNVRQAIHGESSTGNEYTARRKDGTTFPFLIYSTPILTAGQPSGLRGILIDISERKHAEDMLKERESRIQSIFRSAPIGIGLVSNRIFLKVNKRMCEMTGYSEDELIGQSARMVYPSEKEFKRVGKYKYNEIKKYGTGTIETQFMRKDGKPIEVLLSSAPIDPNNLSTGVTFSVLDITERKRAHEQIEQAARKWTITFDAIKDGIALLAIDQTILQANQAFANLVKKPFREIIGKKCHELIHDDRLPHPQCPFRRMLKSKKRESMELVIAGRIFEILVDPIKNDTGGITGAAHIISDITERKLAEEKIKMLSSVVEQSTEGMAIAGLDGILSFVNKAWCRMHGYKSSKELIGKNLAISHNQEQIENEVKPFNEKVIELGAYSGEVGHITRDGKPFPTLMTSTLLKDKQGMPIALAGIAKDITELKQAQQLLQATSRRLQLALRSAKAGTWDWNVATGLIEWSPEMFVLFGLDPQTDHASFESWRKALHPEDRELAESRIEQALKQQKTLDSDYRIILPGGDIRWINAAGIGVYDDQGRPQQMIGICMDITERKQAEEEIRVSLQEKEVLLKEIHHRVKNNLQVISGLLTLQAAQIDDERLQRVLKESQSRIWTMALIHQTLYQTGNLADIDMADYIRALSGNLLSSQAQIAMPPTVNFNLAPLRLVIDKAIPLALIINELLTNTLKHAFPDGRTGEIRISLQERRGVKFYAPTEDTGTTPINGTARRAPTDHDLAPTYELTVADNGVGLPEGFDLKNQKSLGLQLVTMLTKQLAGSLAIESSGGTSVHLTFSNNEKNKK